MSFTKAQAVAEIAYRRTPKPRPVRDFDPGEARTASKAELRAKAGKAGKPKSPKPKPAGSPEEQAVSKLVTRAAQVQAAEVEGEGYIRRVINHRKAILGAGELEDQALAAAKILASRGDEEAIGLLAAAGIQ